jgi:hypothetical protein
MRAFQQQILAVAERLYLFIEIKLTFQSSKRGVPEFQRPPLTTYHNDSSKPEYMVSEMIRIVNTQFC